MKTSKSPPPSRLAYTVDDVLATGAFPTRNKIYNAIARGDLTTWKEGRSRMISADSVRAYVEKKVRDAGGAS